LKKAAARKEALLLDQEMEHLTSLNLDYELGENDLENIDEDDEDFQLTPKASGDKKTVKLSSILPKPSPKAGLKVTPKVTPKATPTTSSRRGRPKGSGLGVKRKRELEEAAPDKLAKKNKADSEPEFQPVVSFRCEMCQALFRRIGSLEAHMKIHRGDHPLACKLCDKAFVRPGSFRNHAQTHMDEPDSEKEVEEESEQDEIPEYLKGTSQSGRVRKAKKMFDL